MKREPYIWKGANSDITMPKLPHTKKLRFIYKHSKNKDIKLQPAFCGAEDQHFVVQPFIATENSEGLWHREVIYVNNDSIPCLCLFLTCSMIQTCPKDFLERTSDACNMTTGLSMINFVSNETIFQAKLQVLKASKCKMLSCKYFCHQSSKIGQIH